MADKLKQAIELIKSGERERARQLLIEQLKTDPQNDAAWVWMASVVETAELKQECLEEALKYNPKNEVARRALAEMHRRPAPVSIPGGQAEFDKVEARPARRSTGHRKVSRLALPLFLLGLIVIAATYVVFREELAYRNDGEVISASTLKLDKTTDAEGAAEVCTADYQFMAYGALRKSSTLFPCTEWARIEKSHLIQIQFQASHPELNRYYPRPQNEQLPMWGGFGLGGGLVIVSLALLVYGFVPKKQASPNN